MIDQIQNSFIGTEMVHQLFLKILKPFLKLFYQNVNFIKIIK